jgi:xanthine dehydrogenase accessory factor
MENVDVLVLRTLSEWRVAGKRALLATVVRTWGSSPRPVGSVMALCEDGTVTGSVSGGCIEDDLIHRHTCAYSKEKRHVIPSGPPGFVKYGLTADEAHRFGLPCGGTLELLLEYNPDAQSLANLVDRLDAGALVRRTVKLEDGTVTLNDTAASDGLTLTSTELANTFGPAYRMLLIGAGQLAEYLATMALFSGFAVTVCDPRAEYRSAWTVGAARLVIEMPDDAVREFAPDRRSCVIALTHDPKLDDLALLEALASEAFYVGAIGSRRNSDARRQRLIEHFGQTPAQMRRLRGPIGIYVASKTPPEIAVSVMAETLAVKNGVRLDESHGVARGKHSVEAILGEEMSSPACGSQQVAAAT